MQFSAGARVLQNERVEQLEDYPASLRKLMQVDPNYRDLLDLTHGIRIKLGYIDLTIITLLQ